MARATKTPAEPVGVVVCVQSFVGQLPTTGEEVSFNAGVRVRANHPAVAFWDKFFMPDGATDAELGRARYAIEDERPIPGPPKRYRAKREIHSVIGKNGLSSGWGPVPKGTILEESHVLITQNPDAFELVK